MKIGIGLPNPVPGIPGARLVEWARRADDAGFSGLVTIDRLAYPSYDSLTTLAAAAGATSRIGLMTNILLAPLYPPVVLAKAAASIDQMSGGRFTLGLAPGSRADDYTITGRDFHTRGRALDEALDILHRAWRGELVAGSDKPVCPTPTRDARVPVLVGGASDQTIRRVTTWAEGWTMGGGHPDQAGPFAQRVRAAWSDAGRAGEPRLAALAYFSLGEDATGESMAYLRYYYGHLGEWADRMAESALRSESAIRGAVQAFSDAGITELYFDPSASSLDQVDRLADVVL
jgi:alkanesulfonate monooxygenase SsuD/methylene tetrahydromethanopterin reductase-like flavin-dependent oxidoreductase (luciferase family)